MKRTPVVQKIEGEERFEPGWQGKRYLICSDNKWHLVLAIHEGLVGDTQCCEDVTVLPLSSANSQPMCETCVQLQFSKKL